MSEWTCPQLERVARYKIGPWIDGDPWTSIRIRAEYVDSDGRRQPAYAATHIKVRVFFVRTYESLDPLEAGLREIPELVSVERIEADQTAANPPRPQVVALVSRFREAS